MLCDLRSVAHDCDNDTEDNKMNLIQLNFIKQLIFLAAI